MFGALFDAGPDEPARAIIGYKGYDKDANRIMARERGAVPVIPYRSNRKAIPARFATALYRGRARIEQMMGKRSGSAEEPAQILARARLQGLTDLPSIGPSLARAIDEMAGTGR